LQDRIEEAIQKGIAAREKEVLSLIISSHSNKEAAKKLNISNRTIDVHRASIMKKMQGENLAELMMMVMPFEIGM
jgi:FixJ family two-component response regulator